MQLLYALTMKNTTSIRMNLPLLIVWESCTPIKDRNSTSLFYGRKFRSHQSPKDTSNVTLPETHQLKLFTRGYKSNLAETSTHLLEFTSPVSVKSKTTEDLKTVVTETYHLHHPLMSLLSMSELVTLISSINLDWLIMYGLIKDLRNMTTDI